MPVLLAAALVYAVMSIVTFGALWLDKRAALRGRWRTPEATLHALEFVGGWPGTLLGQRLLRHKSRKVSYRIVLGMIIAAHIAAWSAALWWRFGAANGGL